VVRHQGAKAAQSGCSGKWIDTAEGWARANVLYEKTNRSPKAGSLREAVFLAVWLKRQEAKVYEQRLVAQAFSDLITLEKGSAENIQKAFTLYLNSVLPYREGQQEVDDKQLREAMQKQVAKGAVTFKPVATDMLKQKVRTMRLPDEFQRALREKAKKGRP
jgi:hypothetical protein